MEPRAYAAGLRPWEVGRFTPGELIATIEAHDRRMIAQAWWHEAFAREQRLRSLEWYLRPAAQRKTVAQARREYEEIKIRLYSG